MRAGGLPSRNQDVEHGRTRLAACRFFMGGTMWEKRGKHQCFSCFQKMPARLPGGRHVPNADRTRRCQAKACGSVLGKPCGRAASPLAAGNGDVQGNVMGGADASRPESGEKCVRTFPATPFGMTGSGGQGLPALPIPAPGESQGFRLTTPKDSPGANGPAARNPEGPEAGGSVVGRALRASRGAGGRGAGIGSPGEPAPPATPRDRAPLAETFSRSGRAGLPFPRAYAYSGRKQQTKQEKP